MQPRSLVVDWQKKPQKLDIGQGDLSESGDLGERVFANSERSTLGHLITFRPEVRLILHTARTVSSSEIPEPRITPLRPHLLAAVVPHVIKNLACSTVNVTSE